MKFNKPPQNKLSVLTVILFIITALVLVGCGSDTNTQATAPKAQINFHMGWVHEYSSAGFYAAEKNGHFAEQNLEVHLIEGGFNEQGYIDPIAQVLDGTADLGQTSASNLLIARTEGKPVVAIAATLQRSPFALISLAESNIVRPSDLRGKRVAIDDSAMAFYQALLSSQGIDIAEVNTVPRTSYGVDPLLNGEVDVLVGWITNEGVLVQEAGFKPNFILPSDYGLETYQTMIFTTEEIINKRPDVVERFLQAAIQGHRDVIAQPKQAIEFTLTYDSSLDPEAQERRLQAALPLLKPVGSSVGMMQPAVWEQTYQILLDSGILSKPFDVKTVYDSSFLEKVYAKAPEK